MKIAVLGAGRVGSTLGQLWHAAGHDVTFAARGAARPRALAAELGERAHAASVAGAVADAEVVLVAVPGPVVTDVLQSAGPLDGHGDPITGLLSLPEDALPPILQMMIADRFKFFVAHGSRFRHRRATLNGFRLERKLDPDDLPEGVELPG